VGDQRTQRRIALEGARLTPPEALEIGLVDQIVNGTTSDILAKAEQLAGTVGELAKGGEWGLIKVGCDSLGKKES
jgi:enoyl-CoA hydratase/carnithine racemase